MWNSHLFFFNRSYMAYRQEFSADCYLVTLKELLTAVQGQNRLLCFMKIYQHFCYCTFLYFFRVNCKMSLSPAVLVRLNFLKMFKNFLLRDFNLG